MSRTPTPLRLPFDDPDSTAGLPDAADRTAAVDPSRNVVLEASAGTGKTRVLVDRYLNLLKAGVEPRNILAITFTRKAAAEMRQRIVDSLRRSAELGEIPQARWRDLRDRLGDIAISTIDAFCLSLLREFPLEADLDPGFEMADETEVLQLVDEAIDGAIVACRAVAKSDPGIELLFAQLGEARLRGGLSALLERRLVAEEALRRFLKGAPAGLTVADVCARTRARLREVLTSVEGGLDAFLADGPLYHPRYAIFVQDVRQVVAEGDTDEPGPAAEQIRLLVDGLREHFLAAADQPRQRWPKYSPTHAPSVEGWRRHQRRARMLAPQIAEALRGFRRDLNVVLTRGVWRVFQITLQEYRRTLERHAVVDFTEALSRTLQLLQQMDEFAQSRYVLEARYQHLLVDEFQDTSQAQWELVWRLVRAWGEGAGLAEEGPLPPSIFVVGDRKQSIYGFRDADVGVLSRAAAAIAGLRGEGDVRRAIRKSFRAVPDLLAFTNDLFDAVTKVERGDAFRYDEGDRFPADGGSGEPVVGLAAARDLDTCAAAVADEVARLLQSASVRDKQTGLTRAAEPGDVAVLFRARDGHQTFERALESRGIPNYVYKGLGFYDADEVKDVFALLRYLADPASNLRTAAVLRSRLVRLSDPALQVLAPVLADAARWSVAEEERLDPEDRAALARARASLTVWLALVDRIPPADLLDRALRESAYFVELAGPRTPQARENLKKIRGLVRRLQNRGYATVARVAEHLERLSAGDESNAAIDAAGSVNLMTVHAAKGLEFPIVFVVHLGKGAGGTRPAIRLTAGTADEEPSVSIGDFASEADDDAAAREREETKRLLYVAVTRARERLYLSAVIGDHGVESARGSLSEVMPASLLAVLAHAADPGAPGELVWAGGTRLHRMVVIRPRSSLPVRAPARAVDAARDDYSAVTAREECEATTVSELVRRDRLAVAATATSRESEAPDARLVGRVVHGLLQRVRIEDPPHGPDFVDLAIQLGQAAADVGQLTPELGAAAVERFRLIAGRQTVRELLESGERAFEVPISVRTGDGVVRGTIDTIIRHPDGRLTVLEFKTGARAPEHLAQVREYVHAVRALDPTLVVDALIVYPDGDVWVEAGTARRS